MCTCIEKYLQLKDEIIQIVFEVLWKRSKKLVKNLEILVEL